MFEYWLNEAASIRYKNMLEMWKFRFFGCKTGDFFPVYVRHKNIAKILSCSIQQEFSIFGLDSKQSLLWVTNMHQNFVPLICLSGKNAVADVLFLCTSTTSVRPSQQDSYESVPPRSTLIELNKWLHGVTSNSWSYI